MQAVSRRSGECDGGCHLPAGAAKAGSMSSSYHAAMRQAMLRQSNLAKVSLTIAVPVFDRSASSNFRWTIEKVDSTFDRLW